MADRQKPAHVTIKARDYSVYFHHATGEPSAVEVHKKHHQTARLGINGPTARAAIAAVTRGVDLPDGGQR